MAVEYTREGRVGYITLNRPPANSYDYAFMEELGGCITAAGADPDARVVIVRSALERFFSAGADVKAFTENPTERNMAMVRLAHEGLGVIARIPKIFIAQIGGIALGGGLEIALACDLRFGAEGSYVLGVPEVTLGLLPGNGGTQRLPRLIGVSRALDLMVTGRRLPPQEAYDLGILNRLVPAGHRVDQECRVRGHRAALGARSGARDGAGRGPLPQRRRPGRAARLPREAPATVQLTR
jgi:enoyl-CoA hydratase/carnithine racemase